MIVRTVLGDVAPASLGPTDLHEHLWIDSPLVADRYPHIHLASVDDAVAELASCHDAGLRTIVDAMPCAAGRNAERLAEISAASGVAVIAATGLHTPKYYVGHPWVADTAAEDLAPLFVGDIVDGIDRYDYTGPVVRRTSVRAGIMKLATAEATPTSHDKEIFAAGAATHRQTGVPLLTHCEEGQGALEQLQLLDDLGVPLERVVLSHTDKVIDEPYHRDILATGAHVEYDQALRRADEVDNATLRLVVAMIEAGHRDQIMLGTDGARRTLWTALGGGPGLAWLLTGLVPALLAAGLADADIDTILVANPARVLAFPGDPP